MERLLSDFLAQLAELVATLKPLAAAKQAPAAEVVELWKAAGSAYSGHWTFYVLGTSAVLGFVFSDKFLHIPSQARKALLALFTLFLLASFVSIIQNLLPYNAASEYLRAWIKRDNPAIADSIYITWCWVVVALHLAVDACALRIVWVRANQPTLPLPGAAAAQ
jgi:DMSO reductase anchor subunit